MEIERVVVSGDQLKSGLENVKGLYGGLVAENGDRVDMCRDNCSCKDGVYGSFQVIKASLPFTLS